MTLESALLLVLAGVGTGLVGSIAGLASLVSYPALLASGLPPIAANVTNTIALFSHTVGSAAGSRAELRGQARRILRLAALAAVGGSIGAVLLLAAPPAAFERIVPFLIALGGLLLVFRGPLQHVVTARARAAAPGRGKTRMMGCAVVLVGVYGGYFGAAAGVLMLAVLSLTAIEPLPVTNAVKNLVTGAANVTAALAYAFVAPVHWMTAAVLAAGCVLGAWTGPAVVRRLPEAPLRLAIGLAALAFAFALWRHGA